MADELTRRTALGAIGTVAAIGTAAPGGDMIVTEDAMKAFALADLTKALAERGRPYHEFLDEPTLSAGIYRLPKSATDGQSPHDLDEVYYVIEGRAKFRADDTTIDVRRGNIIFVKAKAEHRFLDIQEDLVLLVLFSKASPA